MELNHLRTNKIYYQVTRTMEEWLTLSSGSIVAGDKVIRITRMGLEKKRNAMAASQL